MQVQADVRAVKVQVSHLNVPELFIRFRLWISLQ